MALDCRAFTLLTKGCCPSRNATNDCGLMSRSVHIAYSRSRMWDSELIVHGEKSLCSPHGPMIRGINCAKPESPARQAISSRFSRLLDCVLEHIEIETAASSRACVCPFHHIVPRPLCAQWAHSVYRTSSDSTHETSNLCFYRLLAVAFVASLALLHVRGPDHGMRDQENRFWWCATDGGLAVRKVMSLGPRLTLGIAPRIGGRLRPGGVIGFFRSPLTAVRGEPDPMEYNLSE
jgi:hypothetical protein